MKTTKCPICGSKMVPCPFLPRLCPKAKGGCGAAAQPAVHKANWDVRGCAYGAVGKYCSDSCAQRGEF